MATAYGNLENDAFINGKPAKSGMPGGIQGPTPTLGPQGVNPDGTISHQPPAPSAPAPTSPDPFTAMGGGHWTGSGWVTKDHPLAQAAATQPAPPSTPATPGAPAAPTVASAFKDALLNMMNQTQQPVSLSDPTLKPQADAFAVQQQRATQQAREAMAERRAASGQLSDRAGSGAFDSDLRGMLGQQGESIGRFNAGLIGGEAQSRKQQLLQAMGLAGNQVNAEEGRALQERLAQLDAQIRREGISSQTGLGQGDLALRGELGRGNLNLGLLGLLQGGSQFGQNLGAQLGMFSANQNQDALLRLLSGL